MATAAVRCVAACCFALALAAAARPAAAQHLCQLTETIERCVGRIYAELGPRSEKTAAADAAKAEQKQAPKKTETALADVNGLSSSVKDFLPLLQLGGVLGAVQSDDQTGLVTVALNTPFLGSSGTTKKDNALQLKAVIDTTAKLFEPLKQQLPEKGRDDAAKELATSKKDAQNVAVHASYNFSSRRLGRNYEQHADTLDALFEQAMESVAAVQDDFMKRLNEVRSIDKNLDFTTARWGNLDSELREKLEDGILVLIRSDRDFRTALANAVRTKGLDVYGQLVNNQPQLQITASRAFRDDLFGPDLLTARIAFEKGLGNSLNAALGRYNGTCATYKKDCLETYRSFAANVAKRAAIKAGSRFAVFIEFVKNDAYHFTKPDAALDLTIAEGTGWTAGLDYGRLIAVADDGTAGGRVDGAIKWESPTDKTVDRRFVASLTVTKKLGDISIPFGLVYANKPKFLIGVDHGLSANVGLKFNLFPGLN
ncbi:MAG TPA: hypothetical protein VI485_01805 [Vicinamibacterales bacterium]|nr:hypothetical protein [Vicinamibacterales bacterium]